MVERKSELKRRYHRKAKLTKLKTKLARAKEPRAREELVKKIRILSPFWREPVAQA